MNRDGDKSIDLTDQLSEGSMPRIGDCVVADKVWRIARVDWVIPTDDSLRTTRLITDDPL